MLRKIVQAVTAIISNSYLPGFLGGTIYQGGMKNICVPFLNCYSCPGALGACPVGTIQSLAVSTRKLSLYAVGVVLAFGALGGRLVCGWLCPFGFFQELMAKLSHYKLGINRSLLGLKYVILVLTLLLPFLVFDPVTGISAPYFCKYLCPAGTLEAGVPLLLVNPSLRELVGVLFTWKVGVLLVLIIAMIFTWRPFCRVLCPLGAFYALCNKVSLFQLQVDRETCTSCGTCQRTCPAQIAIWQKPAAGECVRCLECVDACPQQALSWSPCPTRITGKIGSSGDIQDF